MFIIIYYFLQFTTQCFQAYWIQVSASKVNVLTPRPQLQTAATQRMATRDIFLAEAGTPAAQL